MTTGEPGWRSEEVCEAIVALLQARKVPFDLMEHGTVRTAEEAAQARGEPLAIGGKALVIKVRKDFRLFVLSAARQLDSRAIKKHFGTSYTRFATEDELQRIVGVRPGSVPPFGEPVLALPLHLDPSIGDQQRLAFNPGMRTRSILMASADYLRIADPVEIFPFARGPL